jgi:hypothetical protein
MKKILLTAVIAVLSASATAQVENKFYAEVGYAKLHYEEPLLEATPKVGVLKFGMNFTKNLAGEILLGTSLQDGKGSYGGDTYKVKIDGMFGVYAKGNIELVRNLELFGRAGITAISDSAKSSGGSESSSSGADVSLGIGLQYHFSRDLYAQIDYMRYYDKDDADGNRISIMGPSISMGFKF